MASNYTSDKSTSPLAVEPLERSRAASSPPPPSPISKFAPPEDWMQPSIDVPPSSRSIRAYTEQMKLRTQHAIHVRTAGREGKLRSNPSSIRSGSPTGSDSMMPPLSRRSSKSSLSRRSMRDARPESVINLGKSLFARVKHTHREPSRSPSSSSNRVPVPQDQEFAPRKKSIFEGVKGKTSRTASQSNPSLALNAEQTEKTHISVPFNFQHITHTGPRQGEQLASKKSQADLLSEFRALNTAETATCDLKGIRAQNLHAGGSDQEWRPSTAFPKTHHTTMSDTLSARPASRSRLPHTKSFDQLSSFKPTHRSREPSVMNIFKMPSRANSMVFELGAQDASPSTERPQTAAHPSRKPTAFHLPISQPIPKKHVTDDYFFRAQPQIQGALDELWPLSSPNVELSQPLPDVPEEEESTMRRTSRQLLTRNSKSTPEIRNLLQQQQQQQYEAAFVPISLKLDSPGAPPSPMTLPPTPEDVTIGMALSHSESPVISAAKVVQDSWEDDIDYCYEHGIEADGDYEWDVSSLGGKLDVEMLSEVTVQEVSPTLSGTSPSGLDGTLSPFTMQSGHPTGPATPVQSLPHARTLSEASSFKESHGFNLSPSLLIPTDFSNAMIGHSRSDSAEMTQFPDIDRFPVSPYSRSSTHSSSYRSSGFSRSSHQSHTSRYSNTTVGSAILHKSQSQECVLLLSRAAASSQTSRNGSNVSLTDLAMIEAAISANETVQSRSRSSSYSRSILANPTSIDQALTPLSPVQEIVSGIMLGQSHPSISFGEERKLAREQSHRRKGSAPLLSQVPSPSSADRPKTATTARPRASSMANKKLGSYGLFPQV